MDNVLSIFQEVKNMIILKEIISLTYWILIILLAPAIFKNNTEFSRKFVHIMIANWWFMAIYLFDDFISACIVPAIFVFINIYATFNKKGNFVTNLKRNQNDESWGLICYPIGYLITLYAAYNYFDYSYQSGIAIMTLGYGDGFAALIGQKYNYIPYYIFKRKKTISGTAGMFVFSFISVFIYCQIFNMTPAFFIGITSAFVGSLVEAVFIRGTDNIFIPLSVLCVYIILWR